ncbi:serine/threonine-protein kinase [Actinokineospora auranticolor]|uniref:non-specific serine/threonine protein kinase n=1 Tax=Actinokineospora auranticolor TaxID=155976 RepID=A0A2S6GYQ2_9PSEU|nr:serine/threonine-protein kinase [Actinokineospora auranticolor]PPK70365.1 serine/threonine protein kinase [Actinokineospora auranticolor]
MDAVLELAASLLSFAHSIFGPGICPGDWVWATSTAGALIALLPVLGTVTVALVRKVTGNTLNAVTISVFGAIGLLTAFLFPWLLFGGIGGVYRSVFTGDGEVTLSAAETRSFGEEHCWVGQQASYLGGRANGYEVLFHSFESWPMLLLRIGMLVVVPALCLLFVMLQARAALRRGPKWPSRLFWLPFVVLILLVLPIEANTVSHLWAGFLPISVLGLIPVYVIGPPSWSVVERSYQKPDAGPPAHHQPSQHQPQPAHQGARQHPPTQVQRQPQQMSAQQRQVPPPVQPPVPQGPVGPRKPPPYVPPPPVPKYVPEADATTRVTGDKPFVPPALKSPTLRAPEPEGALAADPGPLPFTPRGATPPPPIKPLGSRFRKVRVLGQGGFGSVWLAVDTQLDRTVAVKMAHAPDVETEERMLREGRALAAVHHPNCVRVYDIVSEPDGLGLVMEYIEGQPLADRVTSGGALDDVAVARLWITMAGALSAAHAKGVLHRDVKPSNVIIDPDGNAHLIDFGIARSKGDSTLTATGMMVGTPDFLASETAAGANATPASDAWQLAATVSYALTGKPPRGNRENAMAALMAAAKAEPLTELPQRSAHRRLLLAALDPEPGRRPTLAAVSRELSDWLAREGHTETGPVTQIVRRQDIEGEDRTRPVR